MEHLLGSDGVRFELVGVAVAAGLRPEAAAEHAELDRYVELELAGQDPDVQLPGLDAHLAGCLACREERESLRALLAAEGN
jgi:hypothetical protein